MKTEAQLTRDFLSKCRSAGAVTHKLNDRTTSGLPDALVALGSQVTFLEFKRNRPALTDIQRRTLSRLASVGCRAYVVVFYEAGTVNVHTVNPVGQLTAVVSEAFLSDAVAYVLRLAEPV